MSKEHIGEEEVLPASADRPGDILKRAREAKGMTLADVAEVTRVAVRQLEAVERNDFASLPGTPYAVGFSRAFARAVDADEVAIAAAVRAELDTSEPGGRYEMFEPIDPARVPPRWLAWLAAIIALLLAVAYGVWRSQISSPPIETVSAPEAAKPAATSVINTPIASATPAGSVVLTALSDVWLRVYDQGGERLLEKQLAKGESYAVPANAHNPMLMTGRPEALAVSVDGKPLPPLGPPEKALTDFPISAAALLARPGAPATATPAAAPAPAATATPAPTPAPAPAPAATNTPTTMKTPTAVTPHPASRPRPAAAPAPAKPAGDLHLSLPTPEPTAPPPAPAATPVTAPSVP